MGSKEIEEKRQRQEQEKAEAEAREKISKLCQDPTYGDTIHFLIPRFFYDLVAAFMAQTQPIDHDAAYCRVRGALLDAKN